MRNLHNPTYLLPISIASKTWAVKFSKTKHCLNPVVLRATTVTKALPVLRATMVPELAWHRAVRLSRSAAETPCPTLTHPSFPNFNSESPVKTLTQSAASFGMEDVDPVGGFFWDGRADTAEQQALGPLLNSLEMNNKDAASVVRKIATSPYSQLFKDEFMMALIEVANGEKEAEINYEKLTVKF